MEVVNNTEQPKTETKPVKKTSHLRLKVDLSMWHLTTFKEKMNLGPNAAGVTGWQAGFLCFVLMYTKRG